MGEPIPHVVAKSGGTGAAPKGAVPIALYGAGGGGGGGDVASVNGKTGVVVLTNLDVGAPDQEAFELLEGKVNDIDGNMVIEADFNAYKTANDAAVSSAASTASTAKSTADGAKTAADAATAAASTASGTATSAQSTANAAKATADAALPANDKRVPIVITRAAYDALNPPVAGQVYYIQG